MRSSLNIFLVIGALSTFATAITKAPLYTIGQCGGKGYTGPTDCYDPYYKYDCVIVTPDYWACALPVYSQCSGTGYHYPRNRELCYNGTAIDGEGPMCCANGPEWNCTPFRDNTYWCLQIANYTPPAAPTTTITYTTPPAPTGCAAHWGQCGGQGWTGVKCCQDSPTWNCVRDNDYVSQCLQIAATTTIV